jgi:hypothetical protein
MGVPGVHLRLPNANPALPVLPEIPGSGTRHGSSGDKRQRMNYLERTVEDKKVIWFRNSNRYMLAEMPAFEVIERLFDGIPKDDIVSWCSSYYDLPTSVSSRFIDEVKTLFDQQIIAEYGQPGEVPFSTEFAVPDPLLYVQYYRIFDHTYRADYETSNLYDFFNSIFGHLVLNDPSETDHCFQVFLNNGNFALKLDGSLMGTWDSMSLNLLAGKLFLELLNNQHKILPADWMAVFHASAVGDGKNCIVFTGDSGNGKSTVSALLMASGLDLLADDIVRVDASLHHVFYLPVALSIKKNALDTLLPLFPELEFADEFYNPIQNKTFCYLAPNDLANRCVLSYPCKAFVFVKYQKDCGLVLETMPHDIAFQHLVPSSWISPLPKVASRFLDWFLTMPCYRLTYSDNDAMLSAVRRLFGE